MEWTKENIDKLIESTSEIAERRREMESFMTNKINEDGNKATPDNIKTVVNDMVIASIFMNIEKLENEIDDLKGELNKNK